MSTMINRGSELLRISPKDPKQLECSKNNGVHWMRRFAGTSSVGVFYDLTDNGAEILAQTEKGLFYSKNNGIHWNKRN